MTATSSNARFVVAVPHSREIFHSEEDWAIALKMEPVDRSERADDRKSEHNLPWSAS